MHSEESDGGWVCPVRAASCGGPIALNRSRWIGVGSLVPTDSGERTMTEWDVQTALTESWVRNGLYLRGERLFLVAWEVMTDWRINDAFRHFNRPSIDFLFLDRQGGMVALELKRAISTPKDSWSALCQVTHRAVGLSQTFSLCNLDGAHRACYSGAHGRVQVASSPIPVVEAHQQFFRLDRCVAPSRRIRRAVAAGQYGRSWSSVLEQFNAAPVRSIREHMQARYSLRSNKEMARLCALESLGSSVTGAVVDVTIPDLAWL